MQVELSWTATARSVRWKGLPQPLCKAARPIQRLFRDIGRIRDLFKA